MLLFEIISFNKTREKLAKYDEMCPSVIHPSSVTAHPLDGTLEPIPGHAGHEAGHNQDGMQVLSKNLHKFTSSTHAWLCNNKLKSNLNVGKPVQIQLIFD